MKVLLLSAPFVPNYMRNARCDFVSLSDAQWYPILLGYCGAWLEGGGHAVRLIDAPACHLTHDEARKMVVAEKPEWLVVYTGRLSEDNDVAFADKLTEECGCRTLLVGPYASVDPEKTLGKSRFALGLVTGEFEFPVGEVIDGKPPERVPNLVYRQGERIVRNPERPYLSTQDLDRIPFVSSFFARHLDIYRYKVPSEPYPFMDVMTGRGCAWGLCTYCLWVHSYIKGPVYHCRSIDNVIEELRAIVTELPKVRAVMLQDDTLTAERAVEFCEAKLKAGIDIPWSCYSRGDLSYEVLTLMKKADCLNLHVGFESADRRVLRNIRKGVTKERMTAFARDAHRAGLRIHGDFAIGFPGETRETVRKTIEWACAIRPYTAQFQLMIPFPGTPYHAELEEKGWLKDGIPDYPEISKGEMEALARKAYRRFYVSIPFGWQLIKHPYRLFFSRLKTYWHSLRFLSGKKYVR